MPVLRSGPMIKDKNHAGFWKYDHTIEEFSLPLDRNNTPVNIFESKEEQEFFEDVMGGDINLSVNAKQDNYWSDFYVHVYKDDDLVNRGVTFDLGNPIDVLKVKVLKANSHKIASSWEEKERSPKVRYVLLEEGHKEKRLSTRATLNNAAYVFFNKIQNDTDEMYKFLTLFYLDNNNAQRPPEDGTIDTYQAMIQELIDGDIESFVRLVKDPNRDLKMLVWQGMKQNLIQREGNVFNFMSEDGSKYIGDTLNDVVRWLSDGKNSIHLQRLRALVAKDKE